MLKDIKSGSVLSLKLVVRDLRSSPLTWNSCIWVMWGWTNVVVSFMLPFLQNPGGSPDGYSQPVLDGFPFFHGQLASADVPWTGNHSYGLDFAYKVPLGISFAFMWEHIVD